jgi:TetR/AcrR family transcriptional regulator, acrAB operon repressor
MAGRREATSEESRRILLTAAAEVIGERGYRRATLAEIADRAGISRGSIPWHFGSKEGLLATVVEQVMDDMRARFSVAQPLDKAGIAQALDNTVESLKSPQARLLITVMSEAIEDGSPLRPRYAQLHATIRDLIAQWVATDSLPAGVSRDDWATTILGAVMGIHVQWRIAPDAVDLDEAAAALRSLVLASLVDGGGNR